MRLRDLEIKYRTIPQEKAQMREELEAAAAVVRLAKEQLQNVKRSIRKTRSAIAGMNDKIRKTERSPQWSGKRGISGNACRY